MKKRILSLFLALVMVLSLLPAAAWAGDAGATARVSFTAQAANGFVCAPQFDVDVSSNLAESYGYTDSVNGVSALDVLVKAHELVFGTGFNKADALAYLDVNTNGFITTIFGGETQNFGFTINGHVPGGDTVASASVKSGDKLEFFVYQDSYALDNYAWFEQDGVRSDTLYLKAGDTVGLTVRGYNIGWYGYDTENISKHITALNNAQCAWVDVATGEVTDLTDLTANSGDTEGANGAVSFTVPSAIGTRYLTAYMKSYDIEDGCTPIIMTLQKVVVLSTEDYANQVLNAAKDALVWDSIKGTNTAQDNVTSNLTLPSSVAAGGHSIAIAWSCSDAAGALTPYPLYGYAAVDRPKSTDVKTTLTATLSYNGTTDTKTFDLTVKAEGVTTSQTVVAYGSLMRNIAASYTSFNTSDPWAVLEMERYGRTDSANTAYTTALSTATEAKYAISALTQGNTAAADAVINHLKSTDNLSGSYYIYAIPYILLAYDAAGAETTDCTNTRDALVAAMVSYLNNLSANGANTDEVTPILAALAKYYNAASYSAVEITEANYNGVRSAMASAIGWLSSRQNSDGTWSYYGTSCSESTSLAIVALSALGIDAHTDSRFIKNYNSAIEGLMTFALTDSSGFGHKGNVTYNAMSTEQGFRALVAYANFKNGGKAYNIYTDTTTAAVNSTVPAPNISVISAPVVTPPTGSITVSFTLVGDTVHGDASHTAYVTWIPATTVTVKNGSMVGMVFTNVLDENGYTYVGAAQGYVSSITTPAGLTLSEKSNGKNSGWMYSVNGVDAAVGLNDYVLSNGDAIRWFYEDDYTTRNGMGGGSTEQPGAPAGVKYADVSEDAWYKDAVSYVAEKGLLTGTGAGTFSPAATLSRAMLVTALWNLAGKPAAIDDAGFTDVADDAYYAKAVNWAKSTGVAAGYGSAFGASDPITRQQLITMLFGYAKRMGYSTAKTGSLAKFTDVGSITDWAKAAAEWANAEGLMTGRTTSTLAPLGTATRAETAAVLMRFCENF